MSLVFAAIVPHSPLLVPSIGREHRDRLKKTVASYAALEKALVAAKPETIFVISPHGPVAAEHFTIEMNETYLCSMKEFGVFEQPPLACRPDSALLSALREEAEDQELPIMMRSHEALDYGVIVPLMQLTSRLQRAAVVPVYPSGLPAKAHFEFGRVIQDVVTHTNRRVAVICSADLSHKLTTDAPGGFSPRAKEFDDKVIDLLSNRSGSGFINFDQELAHEAGECSLSAIVMFAGILDKIEARPEILSYEGPFGVGYMAARFHVGHASAETAKPVRKPAVKRKPPAA